MGTDSQLATIATTSPPPAKMTWEEFLEWHPDYGMAEWSNIFHSEVLAGLWLRLEWLWQEPLLETVLKDWGLI